MAPAYPEITWQRVMHENEEQLRHWIGRLRNIAAECFDLRTAERLRILSQEIEDVDRTAPDPPSTSRRNYA
jgi:hypothetical protein